MKKLFVIQSILLAGGSLLAWCVIDSWHAAASFAVGAGLVFLNVVLLAWAGSRLMQKKRLALSILVIVFKYAILGAILYKILKTTWVQPMWFCAGVGTLMLASLAMALDNEGEATWQ